MQILLTVWFFILGSIFGSFFGVVGSRLPKKESIIKPGSHCTYCKHALKWYELIPIFSYIIQKGKCRNCGKKLSVFYPIIEIACGLLFSISFLRFGISKDLLISLIIVSFFIIVVVSDVTYLIIPDEITLFFSIIIIIIKLILFSFKESFFAISSGILLFCLMYCIMLLGNKIFKKETLGGADIKLMFFVGLILTPAFGIFNIFVSSCLALPFSLVCLIKDKNNVIPYGPFILLGLYFIFYFI